MYPERWSRLQQAILGRSRAPVGRQCLGESATRRCPRPVLAYFHNGEHTLGMDRTTGGRTLRMRVTTNPSTGTGQATCSVAAILAHRRFDDGNVLLRRSAADSDAGDHLALAGERHAPAHRGVSTARDGEEGIEFRAWLHEWDEVSGADADER